MTYQVLARKWRPKNFSALVGQAHILRALINALDQKRLHHAYLFSGTRGVGKTTIARILAKCLNCEKSISSDPCGKCSACISIDAGNFIDLIEVDAASRTKVEDTRELLENVQYAPTNARFKIYLIDEVHMLSNHSFNALLKTLEEPPAHVKFLLATTDPQKLPITVLSRCLQFHLKALLPDLIQTHLAHILTRENIPFEMPALTELAQAAQGSMRDALSLLDQAIAYSNGTVTESHIQNMLGTIPRQYVLEILNALINDDAQNLLAVSQQLSELNLDYGQTLESLLSNLHQIAILQRLSTHTEHFPELKEISQKFNKADTQLFYQIALLGRQDLPLAPSAKIGFEMILLRMLEFRPDILHKQPQVESDSLDRDQKVNNEVSKIDTEEKIDWSQIVANLELKGTLAMLAEQCQLKSSKQNTLILQLASQHAAILSHKQQLRLQENVSKYLQRPIKLSIEIIEDSVELTTPAKLRQAKIKADKEKAFSAIKADPALNTLLESFDASVDNTSIDPITTEE